MPYDEKLAKRVEKMLADRDDVVPKKMFGGLAFMVGGHMTVGVLGSDLMVRVGPDAHVEALAKAHAREMDFTGRSMKSMVYVGPEGTKAGSSLRAWIRRGLAYTESLPPKATETKKSPLKKKKRPARKGTKKRR